MKTNSSISGSFFRKVGTLLAASAFTVSAFATLGDGRLNKDKPSKSLLSNKSAAAPGTFSLHSGFKFRGSQVITNYKQVSYINLNSVFTYQTGNTTFLMPVQNKVSLTLTPQNQVNGATLGIKF